ncbi:hypothetical protein CHS0354_024021 [Potamilus streckersoni]|uniref:indole-3-glycerol-phosphate synthase n=1 Tax=Potamilus streckersoni TaxID=2493646 RepID=A0AAE0RZI4_9BIVA|nr:hypothetical protein CHS0354_024021 [Potamilus streckersoni]
MLLRRKKELEASPFFERETISLKSRLQEHHIRPNIIAEFKRKSPSKGFINEHVLPEVIMGYETQGAVGISILTDEHFFGGSCNDFLAGRRVSTRTSLLRKEFIVDEFQIIESKSIGADVILLIASMLTPSDISYLSRCAKMLNLDVLLEVHTKSEIETSPLDYVDIIGVNNRDLKTFTVSLETSFSLSEHIPPTCVKISESGIHDASDIPFTTCFCVTVVNGTDKMIGQLTTRESTVYVGINLSSSKACMSEHFLNFSQSRTGFDVCGLISLTMPARLAESRTILKKDIRESGPPRKLRKR